MRECFRCGPLVACSNLLSAIPRPALIQAIVRHATTQPAYDGQPIRTEHQCGGRLFLVETGAARDLTTLRLIRPGSPL